MANKFLLGMVLVYVVVYFFNPSYINEATSKSLNDFIKLIPLFVFVYMIIFIINLYLKPDIIKKQIGQNSGVRGWIYSLIASVLITVPPYVAFPMLGELKKQGMRYALIAAFMNNRHVQPALLVVMAYYFGLKFTIVLSAYILIFAIITGLTIGKILDKPLEK